MPREGMPSAARTGNNAMNLLRTLLIGEDRDLEKRNMVWNMIGSFLYAFASMLLTIVVIQVVGEGEEQGGIFNFAFTTFGQHMFMVAYFGMRPYHITDIGKKYTFGEYLGLRLLTCGGALAFGLFYVFAKGYSHTKATVVFLMVCYKVIDGFADVYEAEFQRSGRLYLTGKSNTFRTLLSAGCFVVSLIETRNLVFSCVVSVAAQALGVLLFDISIIGAIRDVDWTRRRGRIFRLFHENFILFLSVVIDFYVFSAAKYAVENNMPAQNALFGAIFMPTSVINLVAGFVIRPYITKLSLVWNNRELPAFAGVIKRLSLVIGGLTVLAAGGAYFLGIPVLSLLYPKLQHALLECRVSLILIILGGAFNAYVNLFYYSLIIMQKHRHIFVGYVGVAVLGVLFSQLFVRQGGLFGASLLYLFLMAALAVVFGLTAARFYRIERKTAR